MFKEPDVLIVKLEAHLNHIKTIVDGETFNVFTHSDRLCIIKDEVNLMLALIQGARES